MIGRFAACVVVFSTTGLLTLSNYIASDIECLGIITGVGSGRLLQFLQMPNGKDDASNVLTIAKWIKQWAIDAPGKSFHKLLSTDHKTVGKSIFEAAYEFMLSMDDLRRQVPHNELIITALGTAALIGIIKRGLRRYRIATEVPQKYFRNGKRLSGYCVTVNDSDNLRFYHPRLFSFGKPGISRQSIGSCVCLANVWLRLEE